MIRSGPAVARGLDVDHAADAVSREKRQVQSLGDHFFMVWNIDSDQYSSCPTESQPLARFSPAGSACVSRLEI